MNETETRAELVDPALKAAGWGNVEGSRIRRDFPINKGRLIGNGQRNYPDKADYVLQYKNRNLAIIEAKASDKYYTEGVAQAKGYAEKLQVRFTFSTNGRRIYRIDMKEGQEGDVASYPTPDELWAMTFPATTASTNTTAFFLTCEDWQNKLLAIPFEDRGGTWQPRYYQENAVTKVIKAIANNKTRILLTLATGTGKTAIAFQIAWKLFHAKWTVRQALRPPTKAKQSPRILFLSDRNILANQAFNDFSAFEEDALVRIKPEDIRKKGRAPKNGSVFFTIFQTFMVKKAPQAPLSPPRRGEVFSELSLTDISKAPGYVYILQCADGSFFVGSTRRIEELSKPSRHAELVSASPHYQGIAGQARNDSAKLVYCETFKTIVSAVNREKEIKGWNDEKKIALIQNYVDKNTSPLREGLRGASCFFGDYPPDFFDFIIIDECHRGGANDESEWRAIMDYFSPAVQLGLTATPKRKINADTYNYFGEPVYIYSLKDGINDGFLTPFKVRQIDTTIDEYQYDPDDSVLEGEIDEEKRYTEADMNRIIEIREREEYKVKILMSQMNQNEKALVFCASQLHALAIRDLINQHAASKNPNYCHRVTADDGKIGEQHLNDLRNNEKTIPAVLTTSHKLSTGVDAPEVRNIVLLRPINSIIEFKQIIGRGTRLFDGKDYFTIYDFVKAHLHFNDPEWDGEPLEPVVPNLYPEKDPPTEETIQEPDTACPVCGYFVCRCQVSPVKMIRVKLADDKVRQFQHHINTSFWSPDGRPITAEEFLRSLFGTLPDLFKNEDELRAIWSKPNTRKKLLEALSEKGFPKQQLTEFQKLINAENSDLYDVLAYIAFQSNMMERSERAEKATIYLNDYDPEQQEFLNFVLSQYIKQGIDELDDAKISKLLTLKYKTLADAKKELGDIPTIRKMFIGFQTHLYDNVAI